jgi:hypothetical protein
VGRALRAAVAPPGCCLLAGRGARGSCSGGCAVELDGAGGGSGEPAETEGDESNNFICPRSGVELVPVATGFTVSEVRAAKRSASIRVGVRIGNVAGANGARAGGAR